MLKNYFNSGFEFTNYEFDLKLKYHFFNLLLLLNVLAVTMAGLFRLSQQEYTQMAIDFIYVLVSASLAFALRLEGYLYSKPVNSDLMYKFIEENQKN